jgi:hypothetical protein
MMDGLWKNLRNKSIFFLRPTCGHGFFAPHLWARVVNKSPNRQEGRSFILAGMTRKKGDKDAKASDVRYQVRDTADGACTPLCVASVGVQPRGVDHACERWWHPPGGPPGRALTSAHAVLVQSPLESQRRATQMQTLSMNLTVLQRMDPSVVSCVQPASCSSASAKSVRLACAAPHACKHSLATHRWRVVCRAPPKP